MHDQIQKTVAKHDSRVKTSLRRGFKALVAFATTVPAKPVLSGIVEKALGHGTKLLVAILMIFLLLEAWPARAGGGGGFAGATEATQIMNNVELALQSAQEEMQSLELVEQTYLQRLQQIKSSIGEYTAPFQNAMSTYQRVTEVHGRLAVLKGSLQNLDGQLDQRFQQFGASSLTWQGYLDREALLIQDGNQRAISQVTANQEVLVSTQDAMQAYQKAANAMEATEGTHQATRMLGSQLTLLGGDLNKLIAITAQSNAVNGLEMQERAAERESARAGAEQIRKLQAAMDKKRRAELEAVIERGGK